MYGFQHMNKKYSPGSGKKTKKGKSMNKELYKDIQDFLEAEGTTNLSERVEALLSAIADTVNPKEETSYKRWRDEVNDRYYFLDDGGDVYSNYESIEEIDCFRYNIGNYFKTREEAESYKARLIELQAKKDKIRELNEGWVPDWSMGNEKYRVYINHTPPISFDWTSNNYIQEIENDFYVKSQEAADQYIDWLNEKNYTTPY